MSVRLQVERWSRGGGPGVWKMASTLRLSEPMFDCCRFQAKLRVDRPPCPGTGAQYMPVQISAASGQDTSIR